MEILFKKRPELKEKPKGKLGFGRIFTDYMFVMDWNIEEGWIDPRIEAYGPITMDPASLVLHYAQETFEGLKGYKGTDGEVYLFRPEMNARRFAKSNERMCMPELPEEYFIKAIEELLKVEKDWIPEGEGESIYIRPFMFASEVKLGVNKSSNYKFIIIVSPVAAYYAEGINPIKIYVEDEYTRASPGGTGYVKCGGNYAGSIAAQVKAEELGYTQVLWLDGVHRKYVEEVGSMNAMFLIGDKVITAPIEGTVLPGITRDSVLTLLKDWGYSVEERHLSIDELMEAGKNGQLKEAWGTGTAAVVSPIGELFYKGDSVEINNFQTGSLTRRLYDHLTLLQRGELEDKYSWRHKVT